MMCIIQDKLFSFSLKTNELEQINNEDLVMTIRKEVSFGLKSILLSSMIFRNSEIVIVYL